MFSFYYTPANYLPTLAHKQSNQLELVKFRKVNKNLAFDCVSCFLSSNLFNFCKPLVKRRTICKSQRRVCQFISFVYYSHLCFGSSINFN